MQKIINNFLNGKITLWRSYWLVGELLNALFILAVFNFEIYIFGNNEFSNSLPFLDFSNFSFLSKITLIIWTIFITIGIWRSSDKYKGPKYWAYLAKIMVVVGWGYLLSSLGL